MVALLPAQFPHAVPSLREMAPAPEPRYALCPTCMTRAQLLAGMDLHNTRCSCGGAFVAYTSPEALDQPVPRDLRLELHPYWLAGREDGFWNEHRLLWGPIAADARIVGTAAWRSYCAGRRAGAHLRNRARAEGTRSGCHVTTTTSSR